MPFCADVQVSLDFIDGEYVVVSISKWFVSSLKMWNPVASPTGVCARVLGFLIARGILFN